MHADRGRHGRPTCPPDRSTLAFVAYNTLFNLTGDGAQPACFRAVADRLLPGGRFVVEAFVPEDPPRSGDDVGVRTMTADRVVLSVARHDPERQAAAGQFVELTEAGGVRLRPWSIRYATPAQLDAIAGAAGFVLEHRWEAFGGAPFGDDSRPARERVPPCGPDARPADGPSRETRSGMAMKTLATNHARSDVRRILGDLMSQMRLNQLTGRWVTIVAERAQRPTDFAPAPDDRRRHPDRPCPFCPGNEESTPPALETIGDGGNWRVRVVPNLYPAFDGDEGFAVHHDGPVHVMAEGTRHPRGVRLHARPRRRRSTSSTTSGAAEFMLALKRRFIDHAATSHIRYTQAIVNHGREAGASLAHPHGQLLGLPFVPGEMLDEERAFARFAGGCLLCTTVEAELATGERVVFANDDVVVHLPVLERLAVRAADRPPPPRAAPAGRRRRVARVGRAGAPRRRRRSSTRCSATSPTTSGSTPPRTRTSASTTGTSTSGRTSSPRPGSSAAPAC